MTTRQYSSRSQQSTLTGTITSGATSMTVVAGTTLLGGVTIPSGRTFTLVIDPDTALEEIVDATAVATNTFTITRAIDGSTAQEHSAGAVVRHMAIGRDFRDANLHAEASASYNDGAGNAHTMHGIASGEGDVVGTLKTQTLTNKTLTSPTISNPTFTGTPSAEASIIFEGTTADAYETTLTVVDPTQDNTITLPNTTGTVVIVDATQTLTNKTLTSPVISGTPVITGLSSAGMVSSSATPKDYVDSILGSATAAATSAASAATSAASAATSASSASTSASSALTSANSAATSATAAATSAASAATSATAASTSATSAAASASAASTSASSAATSASSASTSASSALTSANSASTSATSASNSATASATSASAAATSATSAAASATAASTSATSAAASATAAATSATSAAASATSAANSASAAATSATSAAASATAASTSETNAAASATAAATSASSASTSASSALTSANSASTSASSAATSAASAATSATSAATSYDQFDDRYLGNKTSDPTVDNDGNPLLTGALYYNTTISAMKVYSGSAWQLVAPDTSNFVDKAAWTGKGAIVSATAASTPSALTVASTNGYILAVNSATSTGLEWVAPNPGDITSVTAGTGLSGGGTSGDVTLSIDSSVLTTSNTATVTNKTVNLSNNILTGTIAQFNTALSDADFATLAGSETLSNKTLTAPRFATAGEIDDVNGNELIKFPATVASAINEITVSNAAVGGTPSISATGDDTNVSLNLVSKGTGTVQVNGVPAVTTTGTQTLTNKTLTTPIISSISNTGTVTLPTATDTLVGRATTDTLTNKTISGTSNTITNVSLTAGVTGTLPVANGGTGVTASTGSGSVVLSTSPTLTTPVLGTPTSVTLTNGTGLPIVAGTTGTLSETRGGTNQTTYTTGDLLYASGTNTLTKRAIGTTNQVLTVSGGVPTWAAAPASNTNWSLLNAGGTTLTGAATITISGISGREAILVLFKLASSVNGGSKIGVRINGDTAGNYYYSQNSFSVNTSYTPTVIEGIFRDGESFIRLGSMPDIASGQVNGYLIIEGCNTSGLKIFQGAGAGSAGTNNGQAQSVVGGYYNSSSTVSSVSLFSDFGNFDNGTVYVYATN